jgi:hypothetical protein
VTRTREGRRNTYAVRTDLPISLPTQRDVDLGTLLAVLVPPAARTNGGTASAASQQSAD